MRWVLCLIVIATSMVDARPTRVLRVCADPNSFPLSSETRPGFENQIADVLARALGARVEYTWWAQRRGFYRNTLKAGTCDLVIGVPVGLDMVRTTQAYYRSAYAFVTRVDRKLAISSFDDPRLTTLKIGVPLAGDDGANPPPVHALARRGIVDNVIGFNIVGDYASDSPPAEVMRAVVDGRVDVAIVWGPIAGGFATASKTRLVVTPVAELDDGGLPMAYSIALGVRRGDAEFAQELDRALITKRREIARVLARWRIPQLAAEATP